MARPAGFSLRRFSLRQPVDLNLEPADGRNRQEPGVASENAARPSDSKAGHPPATGGG